MKNIKEFLRLATSFVKQTAFTNTMKSLFILCISISTNQATKKEAMFFSNKEHNLMDVCLMADYLSVLPQRIIKITVSTCLELKKMS
ncbi:MAG: hypothetical protein ACERKN_20445 [Velocimicrobium sp.]